MISLDFRFLKRGVRSRSRRREPVTPFFRCPCSTMLTLRGSRPIRRWGRSICSPVRCSTEGISLTSRTRAVKGVYLFQCSFALQNQHSLYYIRSWTNLNESLRSGMAVLDVAIPTGYIIQQQKLDAYILSRQVRNLQRAKFLDKKVVFYFDYVSIVIPNNFYAMYEYILIKTINPTVGRRADLR